MDTQKNKNAEKIKEFFIYFKDKCPKKVLQGKHPLDDNRKCKRCGLVSNSEWKLTKDGINYYKLHISKYEKMEIRRKIQDILNKITNENFDILSKNLISVLREEIETPTQIHEASKQLFNKILTDTQYIPMYVSLCSELTTIIVKDSFKDSPKSRKKCETFSFIDEMIILSHDEYKKHFDIILASGKLSDIEKIRMINNIKFVAHLCCKNLLHANIIHSSIKKMLEIVKNNITLQPDEIIEMLCTLLTISGEKMYIEFDKVKIDGYFNNLNEIKSSQTKRIQFIIMDLCDLYRKWKIPPKKINSYENLLNSSRTYGAAFGKSYSYRKTVRFSKWK